ncbi:aspartyl-tRNA(Asn)/glutamyl-tRNA (Gln) amidotransferase subunit B [Exophiala aquamarina CBS 119918]|uniref:Glutamyl-tRNA(Gln) amidotransferase subunit B, mitochondrial n=1 Tax=Exophiala aquamarina CBS 119918 TaxID=1182545 RepID=A0A072PRX2_9EURO|nr:aspartyl-tRNA(Asn)/glutamyl-tRNA (Gln) amidotransferase subunit B [Exophiala aquamarina CBS 119918]KEF62621.1 aspartyl-tRNA(Asn)/glutamyl-tRNA (Gln) amidotransferase subunit B [Exophiala aquamarina CBS 119918]
MPVRWMIRVPQGVSFLHLACRRSYDVQPPFYLKRVSPGRGLHFSNPVLQDDRNPLRKELKDAARTARLATAATCVQSPDVLDGWDLTVGIEVHAQLNTSHKLFSTAPAAPTLNPNTQLACFDTAVPESQPVLQAGTLIPALRAALALDCNVQLISSFDRKHYFYHDQPAGYQITQYYHPFAKDGFLKINSADGLPENQEIKVGIKQVQLEQDTARSQDQDGETTLIDFNRSGVALIEIISLPDLHSPRAAAAYVRKLQALLYAVDAVTTGMEEGGLRADVNVSVRRKGNAEGSFSYSGVQGLGQRTEIKNLSTFKGIEEAIKAERDRQISVLESGGSIQAETRGWSATNPRETRRLRGKEGEVDYRYMPDPDLPPLYIHQSLVDRLASTLPPSPEKLVKLLICEYGLSSTDAETLCALDDGERMIYFQEVVQEFIRAVDRPIPKESVGQFVANWVLHELGALLSSDDQPWSKELVPASQLGEILSLSSLGKITGGSAKIVLKMKYNGDKRLVSDIIDEEQLHFQNLSDTKYESIAREIMDKYPQHVEDIREKKKMGKLQFLMGQMFRHPDKGNMKPQEAERAFRRLILGEK